jgi:hypothetical protein
MLLLTILDVKACRNIHLLLLPVREANGGEIFCTHAWKWRNEICWNYSGMGGGAIKENDKGVNSTMIYCKIFCKYHNVPPVQKYMVIKNK